MLLLLLLLFFCVFFVVKFSSFEMHKGGARKLRWVALVGGFRLWDLASLSELFFFFFFIAHFRVICAFQKFLFGAMRRLILLSGFCGLRILCPWSLWLENGERFRVCVFWSIITSGRETTEGAVFITTVGIEETGELTTPNADKCWTVMKIKLSKILKTQWAKKNNLG